MGSAPNRPSVSGFEPRTSQVNVPRSAIDATGTYRNRHRYEDGSLFPFLSGSYFRSSGILPTAGI